MDASQNRYEQATFGAGCFWCTEAIYQQINGIVSVEPGYAGGDVINPSYEEVCTGNTGHAEVARIVFDPSIISYKDLLQVFWHVHDPTTLNRQGADIGTQYRSVIFYHTEKQKELAEKSKAETNKSGLWKQPIVTQIEPIKNYFRAEDYHKNYYRLHSNAGYCSFVIAPKLAKFRKEFSHLLHEKA